MTRRHFLSGASTVALLSLGLALPARALTVRGMSAAETDSLALACGNDARHASLITAVLDEARKTGLRVDEASVRQAVLLAATCPYCHCPLTDFDGLPPAVK
jgi:hypothetical protein